MLTEIDKETLDFLCKKKLTFNQYCMCLMIYKQDHVSIIKYTNEIGYLTGGTVKKTDGKIVNELDDLLERGILKHDNIDKEDWYSLDNFTVTNKFLDNLFGNVTEMAEELWKAYPPLLIQNEEKPSKAWDKEEFTEKYLRQIKNSRETHAIVMKRVKGFGKYAPMNLKNFVGSNDWENSSATEEKHATRYY